MKTSTIIFGLLSISAVPVFAQTITGHSAMITVTPSTSHVVINSGSHTTCIADRQQMEAFAVAHGIPATGPNNAHSWVAAHDCDFYVGGNILGVDIAAASAPYWNCTTNGGGGGDTGTVTLSGSILGENVILNPKNAKNSLKYSWSLGDPASGLDTSVSWNRVVGPTITVVGGGSQGALTTAAFVGQIAGCPAGDFAYAGQNPQGNPGATPYLYNGLVCSGLASDTQPGNNNDSADRLDYSVPFTFTVADAGTINFTVAAIVKDVAGSTSVPVSVTAGGTTTISAENCGH
jgi:hypothetical protein